MTTNVKTFLLASFSLFLLLAISSPIDGNCAERVYLDISTQETRKIKIAVPWFQNKRSGQQQQLLGRELSSVLGKALHFHGVITIIPQEQYGGNQAANWKKIGADFTILGKYQISSEKIDLEIWLKDVAGNESIMGKTFSGSLGQKEKMLFKFADNVLESLTGKPGIADTRLLFVNQVKRTKEVYLTDILGNTVKQITRHKHLTVSPRFVPGGPYMSYTSYHSGNQNLYITDLRQNKTTRALSRRKGLNLAPAWFAGGKSMILTLSKSGSPDLYRLDRKGKILEQLTSRAGINVSPTLSPDGKHMVFVSDRTGKPQLYHMNLSTRKVRRLTYEGSENAEPNWSPTEPLIVFSSLRNGVYQIYTMNPLENESPAAVTSDLNHHEAPCWSPDGNQIIFAKRNGKKSQIYGIMKNGSFQRKLFSIPGSQTFPRWSR